MSDQDKPAGESLDVLQKDREDWWFKDLVVIAIGLGARRGELLQLTFHDIDFEANKLTFRSETTKAGKARDLPIDPVLFAMLKRRHQNRTNELVFGGVGVSAVTKAWNAATKDTKSARYTFHHLRHTAITHWANSGLPIADVQFMAGHASERQSEAAQVF